MFYFSLLILLLFLLDLWFFQNKSPPLQLLGPPSPSLQLQGPLSPPLLQLLGPLRHRLNSLRTTTAVTPSLPLPLTLPSLWRLHTLHLQLHIHTLDLRCCTLRRDYRTRSPYTATDNIVRKYSFIVFYIVYF